MRKFIMAIAFLFPVLLFAQHAYVVLGRTDGLVEEKFFACGTKLRIKLDGGEKIKGKIDTVFADGMVFAGDTVMFSQVRKFSYKFQNRRFLKNEFIASGIGLGIGGIFAIISGINAGHYPQGADQVQTVAGASAIFILSAGPFFLDALHKKFGWHHQHVSGAWHLFGTMRSG